MTDRLLVLGVLLTLLVAGVGRLLHQHAVLLADGQFASSFLEKLVEYFNGRGADEDGYVWLTQRSVRMQRLLDQIGIVVSFRPPRSRVSYSNYPIILNLLPLLHQEWHATSLSHSNDAVINKYMLDMRDAVIRYIGTLEDDDTRFQRAIRNPVAWYREGVQLVLLSPLLLLAGLGIIAVERVWRLSRLPLLRLTGGVLALIGLVSSCVTITLGGPEFVKIIRDVANRFFH